MSFFNGEGSTSDGRRFNRPIEKVQEKAPEKEGEVKTTLETSEDENYARNEWRWKLHSKRVKMKTTLETSEVLSARCCHPALPRPPRQVQRPHL